MSASTPYVTNVTPFQAFAVEHRFYNGHRYDCLFVKATFRLTHDLRLLPLLNQPMFVINDMHEGDDDTTALLQPSDIIPFKPATDVIVTGHARPANNQPVSRWLARIEVANVNKTVLLTGPRLWHHRILNGWTLPEPEPATSVRLSYSLAWGGASAIAREKPSDIHWPNPFGRGYFGQDKPETSVNYPAAQILPASNPTLRWAEPVESVGLSPVDGQQQARLQFAGTYDERWRTKVAPNIPLDMRLDFWNVVPQDQVANPYLRGGETVQTVGLFPTEDGELSFVLPRYNVFAVPIKGETKLEGQSLPIDTVSINLDKREVTLRWGTLFSQDEGFEEYELVAIAADAAKGSHL